MPVADHLQVILGRRSAGEAFRSIAGDYGVSRERVRQVVRKHVPDLPMRPPAESYPADFIEAVRLLWNEVDDRGRPLSASKIAARLKPIRPTVTRFVILGIRRRHNLPERPSPIRPKERPPP